MKNLGLIITFIGLLIVAGGILLTPNHAYHPVDSVSGINASAGLVYGGFIVFGLGLAVYTATLKLAGEK